MELERRAFIMLRGTITLMIAYLFYQRDSATERQMAEMDRELKRLEVDTELIDADSPRGVSLVEYYDVLGRPAVVLARRDGSAVQIWQGEEMPLIAEISYLAHQ